VKSFSVPLPIPKYAGVYVRERTYAAGDLVTWAGALWHCAAPTSAVPGEGASAWRLTVKQGQLDPATAKRVNAARGAA
jgi:hypothetical protein